MASMWRKAMLYLGLGPDDDYDDYDAPQEPMRGRAVRSVPGGQGGGTAAANEPSESFGTVRPIAPRQAAPLPAREPRSESVEEVPAITIRPRVPASGTGTVRSVASVPPKPFVVEPREFEHAKEVGDRFRDGQPVIMNLQSADRDLSRRLIDFASGLCYGLSGHMERVAQQVYLLTPANVEVSAEERRRFSND